MYNVEVFEENAVIQSDGYGSDSDLEQDETDVEKKPEGVPQPSTIRNARLSFDELSDSEDEKV